MTTETDALPRSFGRYLLFEKIGQGGMAEIFLARAETELGGARLIVIKQVLPRFSHDGGFAERLIDEAKLMTRLRHANIAQIIDLGREQDRLFICMEYVEGFDLNGLLRRLSKAEIPLPAEFAILIVREVLVALDYAHRARNDEGAELKIVHRDVSPSNVLISFEGEVKLCDFGIAGVFDGDSNTLEGTRVAGKIAYMAPEHVRGDAADQRMDLYSAGILLWELCAGRRLHKGTEQEMLAAVVKGEVPQLPENRIAGQAQLQAILDRALSLDPDNRFQRAGDFLQALDTYTVQNKLLASQLRFGSFLTDHFAAELIERRRAHEEAAVASQRPAAMTPEIERIPEAAPTAIASPEPEDIPAPSPVATPQFSEPPPVAPIAESSVKNGSKTIMWFVLVLLAAGLIFAALKR